MVINERCLKCFWLTDKNENIVCYKYRDGLSEQIIAKCDSFNDKTIDLEAYIAERTIHNPYILCNDDCPEESASWQEQLSDLWNYCKEKIHRKYKRNAL